MSETKEQTPMEVDLAVSPLPTRKQFLQEGSSEKKKKMKQTRLPFAPVNKEKNDSNPSESKLLSREMVDPDETVTQGSGENMKPANFNEDDVASNKRKRTESSGKDDNIPSKILKETVVDEKFPQKTPKRMIVPTFLGETEGKKKDVEKDKRPKRIAPTPVIVPSNQEHQNIKDLKGKRKSLKTPEVKPVFSPVVLEDRKRTVKVAIAKLTVEMNEINEDMGNAVEKQEFLKAAELKEQLEITKKRKNELEDALDKSLDDINVIEDLVKFIKSNAPVTQNEFIKSSINSQSKSHEETKEHQSSSSQPSTPGSSKLSPVSKSKKLTPKQEAKKQESLKKKEEKDRQKEEQRLFKEKQKEEERRKKEEAKKVKEAQKKAERIKKEIEKKQKEAEKLQEKKAKEDAKLAEQKKKQEEKERKLEEKRRQEEEEKLKQEKIAKSFTSFFIKKDAPKSNEKTLSSAKDTNELFNKFQIKSNMRIAPFIRREFVPSVDQLDSFLNDNSKLYLDQLRDDNYKPGHCGNTWPSDDIKKDDTDIEILEYDEEDDIPETAGHVDIEIQDVPIATRKMRVKLLQFCENQRPPYYGTWRKKSRYVGPRRPFGRDDELFDYEYDSDEDWEEEEQGESLSDEEKDKEEDEKEEEEDEEDDDDGFFVGHGVLDKEELLQMVDSDEELEDGGSHNGKAAFFDEELEEKKQKLRAQQFEEEYKKKRPSKLKPRVFGCMWIDQDTKDIAYEQLVKILSPYRAVTLMKSESQVVIPTSFSCPKGSPNIKNGKNAGNGTPSGHKPESSKTPNSSKTKKVFPEEHLPDLFRLVHCNVNNKIFLAREFSHFLYRTTTDEKKISDPVSTPKSAKENEIPKRKILEKILEVAEYKKLDDPNVKGKCWLVKNEYLEKYKLKDTLKYPNEWTYSLEQPNKSENLASLSSGSVNVITPKRRSKVEENKSSVECKTSKKNDSIQALFMNMKKKDNQTNDNNDQEGNSSSC